MKSTKSDFNPPGKFLELGTRIALSVNAQHAENAEFGLVLIEYANDFRTKIESVGVLHLVVAEVYHTMIGESYRLHAGSGKDSQFFLKLPSRKHSTHQSITHLDNHFQEEFRTLSDIAETETDKIKVPLIVGTGRLYLGGQGDRNEYVPALLEQYIAGPTLTEWLHARTSSHFNPSHLEKAWFEIAYKLADTVRQLHNVGIVHASIQPDHVIVVSAADDGAAPGSLADYAPWSFDEVYLVGFGTSALLYEPKFASDVRRRLKVNPFVAPELKRLGRTEGLYSYPADIYSLGMVFYFIANRSLNAAADDYFNTLSKDVADIPQDVGRLKTFIADRLRRSGTSEWKRGDGIARVIDKCLRHLPADRFICIEELMRFIAVAAPWQTRQIIQPIEENLTQLVSTRILTQAPNSSKLLKEFITRSILREPIARLLTDANAYCEFWGGRDEMLDRLCDFVSALNPGDEYCTLTIPGYWTDNNLGTNGRFLVLNRDLAEAGVIIRRIFVVDSSFDQLPIGEQNALIAQAGVVRSLNAPRTANAKYEIRVLINSARNELYLNQLQRRLVAFVRTKESDQEKFVGILFRSRGEAYRDFDTSHLKITITKVGFKTMSEQDHAKAFASFNHKWTEAVSLNEYIGGGLSLEELFCD